MPENNPDVIGMEILILYHSQSGNTKKMAEAVARGVDSIKNVRARLKPAGETTLEDFIHCQGVAIGSPEYFGYMAGMIKDFFDRTYYQARGRKGVTQKPYVVFISAGNDGTGALRQIERICLGYPLKKVYEPIVAVGEISEEILSKCEELGKTIAAGCEAGIY
ncbi:MAG: NAD(P)H-dependent oxidoreductase [Deltaproteobacteria bacterium]|nr:NAD(P)H-dependent oxidoreductase [Deltaproteobacteria bacterium]